MRLELPPRTRRILFEKQGQAGRLGTTSACAENTRHSASPRGIQWNYLRVRGEYEVWRAANKDGMELPPRARRIPCMTYNRPATAGTTSACAENTKPQPRSGVKPWNYLRVRGEYRRGPKTYGGVFDRPPRARRIHTKPRKHRVNSGTTSACAENTLPLQKIVEHLQNYLRVRGEYNC